MPFWKYSHLTAIVRPPLELSLHPPDSGLLYSPLDVLPVPLEGGEGGVDQLEERPVRMPIAVVRRRGEQHEPSRVLTELLAQPVSLGPVRIRRRTGLRQGMGFVDDHQIPTLPEGTVTNRLPLQEIDRGQDSRQGIPRVDPGGKVGLFPGNSRGVVEDCEIERESFMELIAPLIEEPGRSDDEHPPCPTASHQLEKDEPGFDGLPEADVIGDEEARARFREEAEHRRELVGLQRDAPEASPREQARLANEAGGEDAMGRRPGSERLEGSRLELETRGCQDFDGIRRRQKSECRRGLGIESFELDRRAPLPQQPRLDDPPRSATVENTVACVKCRVSHERESLQDAPPRPLDC